MLIHRIWKSRRSVRPVVYEAELAEIAGQSFLFNSSFQPTQTCRRQIKWFVTRLAQFCVLLQRRVHDGTCVVLRDAILRSNTLRCGLWCNQVRIQTDRKRTSRLIGDRCRVTVATRRSKIYALQNHPRTRSTVGTATHLHDAADTQSCRFCESCVTFRTFFILIAINGLVFWPISKVFLCVLIGFSCTSEVVWNYVSEVIRVGQRSVQNGAKPALTSEQSWARVRMQLYSCLVQAEVGS